MPPATLRGCINVVAVVVLLLTSACASVGKQAPTGKDAEAQQYLQTGMAAAQKGQHELALSEYVKGLAAQPRNAELHFRVAESQVAIGKTSEAAVTYRRVLGLQPDHAGALQGLGLLLLKQGQYEPATKLLTRSVELDPTSWRSLNGLAAIADLKRDYAQARDYYNRAVALQPNSPVLLNNLGYSRYLAGSLSDARSYFEQALRIDPQYGQAWRNLGLVMARQGQLREAVRAFSQTMPEAEAAYTTGYVCMLENRLADAQSMFQRAIDLSPSYYPDAEDALARVKTLRSDLRSEGEP
ncbi:tetratricopeptide repeat protein [Fontimonas sp. SYSU GA230001]|uniref:tetratricopeptide repeat protein n=1 Tax=Fontimonas sp. SYSU GA230001 TaxID=3142450 RepID=UPI0032B5E175